MNRLFATLASLALGAALIAGGQTSAAQTKIAVIAFQGAVTQTNEFQRDFADIQKKYEPKRQQLQALTNEIDTLTKQLQSQGSMLSNTERIQRSGDIQEKQKEAQRMAQDDQSDYQSDVQNLFNLMASKVGAVMNTYAQQHGFSVVLDAGQTQNPTVIYASPATDITKAVIQAYNLKSGVPAPPATASTAPGPQAKPAAARPTTRRATRPATGH